MNEMLDKIANFIAENNASKIISKDDIHWIDLCMQLGKSELVIPEYIIGELKEVFCINFAKSRPPSITNSFSYVTCARNINKTGKKYICKIYAKKCKKYFQQEIEVCKILGLEYDYQTWTAEQNCKHYLFRPYIPGVQLNGCDVANIENDNKIEILLNITSELKGIHSKNIIHCDLSLSNIIIDIKKVSIIDYSVATIIPQGNIETHPFTTLSIQPSRQLPPELEYRPEEKKSYIGPKTDVFFLGGIIKFLKINNPKLDKIADILRSHNMADRPSLIEIEQMINQL